MWTKANVQTYIKENTEGKKKHLKFNQVKASDLILQQQQTDTLSKGQTHTHSSQWTKKEKNFARILRKRENCMTVPHGNLWCGWRFERRTLLDMV
ncbi:CLUMA_CG012889, isoform A [Clunio marinus]|uniref:CLUMA_CG012889, isoform A n=1 Tax=Clunio marinus TaxID=568069 RepID=A0A1J1IH97_9DIPT|nr:CLUMA_CG012889, isoform A [Clunio marinus]